MAYRSARCDGGDHDLDRRVALRVRAGLQTEAVRATDQAPQLGGLVVELAVVAGVEAVAALEVGGEARQRAVGVELQPGEGEVVVAEARAQAEFDEHLEQRREGQHRDAHLQPSGVARREVRLHLAARHLAVRHRRHACSEQHGLGVAEQVDEALGGIRDMDVGSVVERLDALRPRDQVDRRIPHHARRVALLVALDAAARWVRQVLGDAVHRETVAVDHHAVPGAVHDRNDAVGGDAVEVGALRIALHVEVAMVDAEAPDVGGRRQRVATAAEHLDEGVDRRHLRRRAVDPRGALAEHQRVRMRVDEPRQERAAAKIELGCIAPGGVAAVRKRADVQDPLVEHRDGLGAHLGAHRQDRSAGNDCASVHGRNRIRSPTP
jgi:hypothetical protein